MRIRVGDQRDHGQADRYRRSIGQCSLVVAMSVVIFFSFVSHYFTVLNVILNTHKGNQNVSTGRARFAKGMG